MRVAVVTVVGVACVSSWHCKMLLSWFHSMGEAFDLFLSSLDK